MLIYNVDGLAHYIKLKLARNIWYIVAPHKSQGITNTRAGMICKRAHSYGDDDETYFMSYYIQRKYMFCMSEGRNTYWNSSLGRVSSQQYLSSKGIYRATHCNACKTDPFCETYSVWYFKTPYIIQYKP